MTNESDALITKAERERHYDLRTPIIRQIYDVMQAIEACGASEKLTHAVTLAGALMGPVRLLLAERDVAAARIAALEVEVQEEAATRELIADVLERTVNVFRGPPEPNTLHSWHDLPELARAATERAQAAEQDARRYRWLRICRNDASVELCEDDVWYQTDGVALDAAIDAALASQGKEPT